MGKTIKALRRGIKAGVVAAKDPPRHFFQAAGKTIVCSHCGNKTFTRMGMAGITLAGSGIACSKCSHIEYFRTAPSQSD